MNFPAFFDLTNIWRVQRLTQDVKDVSEDDVTDRNRDTSARVAHRCASQEAVGWLHTDTANPSFSDLLSHLSGDGDLGAIKLQVHLHGVVDLWKGVRWKLHVHYRSSDRYDATIL